jgi:hypothetical protein
MNFQEALRILNIEDYSERIFKSNSHGELFHLEQYIRIAETLNGNDKWFRNWFESVVKFAEENHERPESVFQHIDKLFIQSIEGLAK